METITCYTRGITKGSPGPAAVGVTMMDAKGEMITELSETVGNASVEYAEYFAVIKALQLIVTEFGDKTKDLKVEIKISNKPVQQQLNDEAIVVNPGLVSLFMMMHNMKIESFTNILFTHVDSKKNKVTAAMLNKLLDGK